MTNFHNARNFANELSERQVEIFQLQPNSKTMSYLSYAIPLYTCVLYQNQRCISMYVSVATPDLERTNSTNLVLFLHAFHPVLERFKAWPEVRVFLPALQHDSVPENMHSVSRNEYMRMLSDQFRIKKKQLWHFVLARPQRKQFLDPQLSTVLFGHPVCNLLPICKKER